MENGDIDMTPSQDSSGTDALGELAPAIRQKPKNQTSRYNREVSVDMLAQESDSQNGSSSTKPPGADEPPTVSAPIDPTSSDLPSIDEQIERVTTMAGEQLREGQKGYIIANKWLARVLARGSRAEPPNKFGKGVREGPIGPVDNTGLNLITDPSISKLKDEKGEPLVPLRPGLVLGEDFEVLPEDAWNLIIKWYGLARGSPILMRYCHNTSLSETEANMQYELNPPVFTILKLPAYDGTTTKSLRERDAVPIKISASRHQLYQSFLKQAKEKADIDMDVKVRVWRILGGLERGGYQSGMITPAASRSNSPAPGAVATVDPGDKLVIDLNVFSGLQLGTQKEKIDQADQTANNKYNGFSSMDRVGLRQDEVIILEEQVGGPAGGHWPSGASGYSKSKKGGIAVSVTKNGSTSVQNSLKPSAATSRSTSPAPSGMMTRGRQAKNGRTRGTVGLGNLGNTCYMNSALQCVRSAKELTYYFLEDGYVKELNPQNPLAHNGAVAKSYAALLKEMYSPNALSAFTPRNFKNIIGKYGPSFSGYQQQDSQEFLLFLLDGLQEDLNRIHKKPYIEKPDSTDEMVHDKAALAEMAQKCWSIYKARNDSVITDLFAGMYKSTVVCPVCDKVSIIFDPFNNLTLQLPIESLWSRKVLVFPLHSRPVIVSVDIDKNATFSALKEFVAAKVGLAPKQTLAAELYKNAFYRVFRDTAIISEEHIADSDIIGIWEFPDHPTNHPTPLKKTGKMSYYSSNNDAEDIPEYDSPVADRMLVPIFHRRLKGGQYRQNSCFATPSFIVLDREENKDFDTILRKVLARVEMMTTRDFLREDGGSEGDTQDSTAEDSDTALMNSDEASEVQAKSLESEDGMVDISMSNGETRPTPPQRRIAPMLKPASFIPPKVRNLFEMKVVPGAKTMIPTGISHIAEDRRDYEILRSRQSEAVHQPRMKLNDKIQRHQSIVDGSPATSDEDADDVLPSAEVPSRSQEYISDSDDEGLPPVEQIVRPTTGFGMFSKSTARNSKGLITYSKKDKRAAAKPSHSKAAQPSRETTPPEKGPLLQLSESILVDWHPDAYDAMFYGSQDSDDDEQMRGVSTWEAIPTIVDPELEEKRRLRSNRRKNGVTLGDCLDEFGKPEILSENDAWYCPRCKEHRRASKTFELWKAPDILVVHLKRFSAQGRFRDKLDVFVDFPTEGLDLSTRLAVPEEGKSSMYDLFAVDNHYGGLGGGHYTAYAQNFVDQTWYEYNDSFVSRRTDPKVVVTSAAYLLFYRRRSPTPLGGPYFEQLLNAAETEDTSDSQTNSRAPSPAGEGKRLDDSSRTGSSSALRGVGAAHQAGDGGSAVAVRGIGVQKVRKGIDDDEPVDSLPGYSARDARGSSMEPMGLEEPTLESMEVDEDEGIGGMDDDFSSRTRWQGPLAYNSGPTWAFGSNGRAPAQNSPRGIGGENEADEDLFADDSSTKVAKSSIASDDARENRMADFNDDEGTTSGFLGTPPDDAVPIMDIPPPVDDDVVDPPPAVVVLEGDEEFTNSSLMK